MDKKITIDLIKIDVLNLSSKQDSDALQYLMKNDDDFPWKEFGDYQNLVSVIAASCKIINPPESLLTDLLSKAKELKPDLFKSDKDEIHSVQNEKSVLDIYNKSKFEEKTNERKSADVHASASGIEKPAVETFGKIKL